MSKPQRECDIVMKGGITSGVIYPGVIHKLKDTYRFRGVGGTSAGAIAAAGLAAAEVRRQRSGSDEGFARLHTLPTELGETVEGTSRLFRLFAPQPETKRLFDIATSLLRANWSEAKPDEAVVAKLGRGLYQMARAYWYVPVGAALFSLLVLPRALPAIMGPAAYAFFLSCYLLLALLLTLTLLGACIALDVRTHLSANHLGLCRGSSDREGAFSDWLERFLDDTAGLATTGDDGPLTFAHLKAQGVDLKMFTTCVSRGIPLTVPFAQKGIYFKPKELHGFFSPRIIEHLTTHARESDTANTYNKANGLAGSERLLALPDGDALPVVVAVRLSMSFPLLFSAVPFYMRRHRRPVLELDEATEEPEETPDWVLERTYFTDGGICSNFPVDFFDIALPSRPTFAIDLEPIAADTPAAEDREVWMPESNRQGVLPPWKRFARHEGFGRLSGYLTAMFETGFTWRDTYQSLAAASRSRICHISVFEGRGEGGLNLNMPAELIETLSRRGETGGALIVDAFAQGGWENHRWQRFRNVVSAMAAFQDTFTAVYTDEIVQPTFAELMDDPPSAHWSPAAQRAFVETQMAAFVAYVNDRRETGRKKGLDMSRGAPKPPSEIETATDPSAINLG